MENVKVSRFGFSMTLVVILFVLQSGQLNSQWLDGWGGANGKVIDMESVNNYSNGNMVLFPVVVDLIQDQSTSKNIIVVNDDELIVFDADGDERFTIPAPANYDFIGTPSAGDIIGDDDGSIEIVVGARYFNNTTRGKVFVFSGDDGTSIGASDLFYGPGTPVLADLESSIENSREDGDLEIVVAGVYPSGEDFTWNLIIFDWVYDDPNWKIDEVESDIDFTDDHWSNQAMIYPAIGDVNLDGTKEIVLHTYEHFYWWTYDNEAENHLSDPDDREYPFLETGGPNHYGIGGGFITVLGDIENEGKLWAIAPYQFDQRQGNDPPYGKLIVLDISVEGGEEHSEFDGNEVGELFPEGPGFFVEGVALGDMRDVDLNDDGNLAISANFGEYVHLKSIENESPNGHWPRETDELEGSMPMIANVGTADDDIYRVIISHENDNYGVSGFSIDGENRSFGSLLSKINCNAKNSP